MEDKIAKRSEIKFTVSLDENKHPVTIEWEATDSGMEGAKKCESIMLSIWDSSVKSSYRIDLWTDKMIVDDMKRFMYETLATMADTYERATSDNETASEMRTLSEKFAQKANL
ncbi:MAG: gliding motility protein GldC [Bacteroidia bacterium]